MRSVQSAVRRTVRQWKAEKVRLASFGNAKGRSIPIWKMSKAFLGVASYELCIFTAGCNWFKNRTTPCWWSWCYRSLTNFLSRIENIIAFCLCSNMIFLTNWCIVLNAMMIYLFYIFKSTLYLVKSNKYPLKNSKEW